MYSTARRPALRTRVASILAVALPVSCGRWPWCTIAAGWLACAGLAAAEPGKEDLVLYRNEAQYAAFPGLFQGEGDELWVSFNWNTTRSHFGKAAGGQTGSVILYSPDGGRTWREKADADYKPRPPQSGLALRDGTRISIGPLMHEVLPAEKKQELLQRGILVKEWPDGHLSASYRVKMTRQRPGQAAKVRYPDLPAFASMGGFGLGVVLPSDVLLKPVYGRLLPDDAASRTWVLRSEDRGDSWQLVTVANDGEHSFNESDLLALPDGRVLAMIRIEGGQNATTPPQERGRLWQAESADEGKTWSAPRRTDIWGYPPTLLRLRNGDLLCSYGYRRAPYGIRACFSHDQGRTWDTANEVILRADALPDGARAGRGTPSDLGYPRSVELADGTIFTVYYITLGDGVTHIAASRWAPDFRGPAELPRAPAAVPQASKP